MRTKEAITQNQRSFRQMLSRAEVIHESVVSSIRQGFDGGAGGPTDQSSVADSHNAGLPVNPINI